MKSIRLNGGYGLENIHVENIEVPTLSAGQVLVKVQAVSLNRLDLMIAQGAFRTSLPHTLGSDATGEVVAIGSGVTHLTVGDRVVTHFIQDWQAGQLQDSYLKNRLGTDVQGVFSEYVALAERALVKVPSNLTSAQVATLPIAGVSAWEALINIGKLQSGQTVLLQGTGGGSILALQFAKAIGAKVIITSGKDEKLEKAKALGADQTINYLAYPKWQEKVLQLTEGKGVDLALEMSWASLEKTVEAMRLGGKIIVVGLLGGADTTLSVFGIMQKALSIHGMQVGSKASFQSMNHAIALHAISPVVDRVFRLDQVSEAFNYLDKGEHFGKVVITF
ncbi:zinc-dependent alcohol dehydrogenase family protein [Algoriphagus resistens]|uniref:zinc-dependent alcohol dehydrogenase family protein n=1 Tax=Algoriphagus resistens TaxID=1750590 RepID=UPI000716C43A|nr:NAD(P)-dependent alcohol dehydrogenase [Algoriphagus resistens]